MTGTFVESQHSLEIKDQMIGGRQVLHHGPNYGLRGAEIEVALQLIHLDARRGMKQLLSGGRRTQPTGTQVSTAELQTNGGTTDPGAIEHVEIAMAGNGVTDLDPPDAVAPGIQQRGKDPDPHLTR